MAPREHINPYVGPRAFEPGEALYGRDRELLEFLDLLIAERIVVLYSPSGAGKTSLIQAALLPKLDKENFEVLPILRVNQETPPGTRRPPKANRYMLSVMLYLERSIPDQARLDELAVTDFSTYLDQRETSGSHNSQSVLIFDQFEEVLTLDSTDRKEKTAFFDQVGARYATKLAGHCLQSVRNSWVHSIRIFDRYQLGCRPDFAWTSWARPLHSRQFNGQPKASM